MNKNQLINVLSKNLKITKKGASIILDKVLRSVIHCIKKFGMLKILKLGTFKVRGKKKKIQSPSEIKKYNTIVFKCSKEIE